MKQTESHNLKREDVSTMMHKTGAVVRLRGLFKRFGRTIAVDRVDLRVESGEFLTVLGPSGSGKTTILRLLAGFETPTEGAIELDGEDVAWTAPAGRNIGMVFQHYALFPHMSVAQNIEYGLKMHGWPKAGRKDRIDEMLRLVRLEGLGDRQPRQLSGGQQQRVALARALAFGPRVLLMDEPLGALDKALRLDMGEEIRRIHRETGTTVVYVTHDQEEALALSDRVAIMRHGRLVASGTPMELYRYPPSQFVATFFGGCNLIPAELVESQNQQGRVRYLNNDGLFPVRNDVSLGAGVLAVHAHDLRAQGSVEQEQNGLVLPGRVREKLFMGDGVQLTCDVPEAGKVTARDTLARANMLEVGDEVTLTALADDVVFIPSGLDEDAVDAGEEPER
jgi:putative spermidine/putrescine transport system ATP-binding protein